MKISKSNKSRKGFIAEALTLFICIKGRINFLQLARYGKYSEQRYRQQFEKPFDFMDFNKELLSTCGSGHYIVAFDPSYICKSGKKTPGVGYFWSGCAGQSKWGLEIGGIAAVDIENNTALHLEAVQTIMPEKEGFTLADWYAEVISKRAVVLKEVSPYLVVDAWFSKKSFCDAVIDAGMHMICRLRDDADLKYLYRGEPTGKPGRPRKYAGKVNNKSIDKAYFTLEKEDDQLTIYSGDVYSKSLKRTIKLLHVTFKDKNGKEAVKLYFSTDTTIEPLMILEYYRSRFQIEFLYRDGKQYTGLNDSQARSKNKLDFHFNASLTAINLAKAAYWLGKPKEVRGPFSMRDIETLCNNELLLEKFIGVFGINPYSRLNKSRIRKLAKHGMRAA